MTGGTNNVVLTRAAAEALCREFIGWQCRLRQLAAREDGGRPSTGMRPRVLAEDGREISPGMVALIVESEAPTAATVAENGADDGAEPAPPAAEVEVENGTQSDGSTDTDTDSK